MHPELTNLLPPERTNGLKREYFVRLATVAVFALAAVTLGSGALLIPSYLYTGQQIQLRNSSISDLDSKLAASQGKEASARLTTLTASALYLSRLGSTTTATGALRGVLSAPRTGISLSVFTFTPPTNGNVGRMTVGGIAASRESLRAYTSALTTLPFVSSVDLPISAYAQESQIPFVITLTGTLAP